MLNTAPVRRARIGRRRQPRSALAVAPENLREIVGDEAICEPPARFLLVMVSCSWSQGLRSAAPTQRAVGEDLELTGGSIRE